MPSTKCIRQRPDGRWVARYRFGQKTRRKVFDSKDEAVFFIRAECRRLTAFGQMAVELTGSQLGRIISLATDLAKELNKETPKLSEGVLQLEKAVQFWIKHRAVIEEKEAEGRLSIADGVEKLILHWKKTEKDRGYTGNAGSILRRFGKDHPGSGFRHLTPAQILNWILTQSPGTQLATKARISALFSFAIMNGWAESNPCALFKLDRRKPKPVQVPGASEIRRFLEAAKAPQWQSLIPYLGLRLFCGLRGEEAAQSEWRHLDFTRAKVAVPYGVAAKGGPAREVPLSENLKEWLQTYRTDFPDGKIAPANVPKLEREFRKAHGFVGPAWFNVLRHCFGSYRYPILGNLDLLANEMGNSRRVLARHYVGAVNPEDVEVFWSILP